MRRRGAREKCPELLSIVLSAFMNKDDIIMDWQCGVGLFFIPLIFILIFLNF